MVDELHLITITVDGSYFSGPRKFSRASCEDIIAFLEVYRELIQLKHRVTDAFNRLAWISAKVWITIYINMVLRLVGMDHSLEV